MDYNKDVGRQRIAPFTGPLPISSCSSNHGYHQHVNVTSCNHCSQRGFLDLSLSPRKDSYWPSLDHMSYPRPVNGGQGWWHSLPPLPYTVTLIVYGSHSTHHKLSLPYLLCLFSVFLTDVNSMSRHVLTCSPLYLEHQSTVIHENFSINTSKWTHPKTSQKSSHI